MCYLHTGSWAEDRIHLCISPHWDQLGPCRESPGRPQTTSKQRVSSEAFCCSSSGRRVPSEETWPLICVVAVEHASPTSWWQHRLYLCWEVHRDIFWQTSFCLCSPTNCAVRNGWCAGDVNMEVCCGCSLYHLPHGLQVALSGLNELLALTTEGVD